MTPLKKLNGRSKKQTGLFERLNGHLKDQMIDIKD
jgi:hypothetical protein